MDFNSNRDFLSDKNFVLFSLKSGSWYYILLYFEIRKFSILEKVYSILNIKILKILVWIYRTNPVLIQLKFVVNK